MTTMTINIADETASIFRETVKRRVGTHKGALGQAVQEALQEYVHRKEQQAVTQEAVSILRKGYRIGLGTLKCREDLYDR